MNLKLILIAAAAAQLMAAPALAQPADPAPSPERLKLAHEVFDAMGGTDNIAAAMDRAMAAMDRGMPTMGATEDKARGIGQQAIKESLPRIVDAQTRAYAETFDEAQLRDILAFYRTPTGQIMRAKLPELSQKTGEALGRMMPALLTNVLQRVCAQTTCTDQQTKTLEALQRQAPAP